MSGNISVSLAGSRYPFMYLEDNRHTLEVSIVDAINAVLRQDKELRRSVSKAVVASTYRAEEIAAGRKLLESQKP